MKQFNLEGWSVETDNDEQSKELQEMAFEQGFEWASGGVGIKYILLRFFSFSDCIIGYGNCHTDLKPIHFNEIKEYLKSETIEEKLAKAEAEVERFKKEIEEQNKPKPGDMVLVSNDDDNYRVREYIGITSDGKFLCWYEDKKNALPFKYIKPYKEEIKVGDWVKRISDETIWRIRDEADVEVALNSECTKITNPQLIKLLENEII